MKNENTKYKCIICEEGTNTLYSGKCEKCEFKNDKKNNNLRSNSEQEE